MFGFVGKVFIGTLVGVFTLWGVFTGLVVGGVVPGTVPPWLAQWVGSPRPQTTLGQDLARKGIYPTPGGARFVQPVSVREGIGTPGGGQWSGSRGSSGQVVTPVVDVQLSRLRVEFDRTYDPGTECTKVKQGWERMTECVNKRIRAWNEFSKEWQDKNAPHMPTGTSGPASLVAVNTAPGASLVTSWNRRENAQRIRMETIVGEARLKEQARPHLVKFVERKNP